MYLHTMDHTSKLESSTFTFFFLTASYLLTFASRRPNNSAGRIYFVFDFYGQKVFVR